MTNGGGGGGGWWGCGARAVDIIIVHRYDNVAFRQSLPHPWLNRVESRICQNVVRLMLRTRAMLRASPVFSTAPGLPGIVPEVFQKTYRNEESALL